MKIINEGGILLDAMVKNFTGGSYFISSYGAFLDRTVFLFYEFRFTSPYSK